MVGTLLLLEELISRNAESGEDMKEYQICLRWIPDNDKVHTRSLRSLTVQELETVRVKSKEFSLSFTLKGGWRWPLLFFRNWSSVTHALRSLRGYCVLTPFPEDKELLVVKISPKPRRVAHSFLHFENQNANSQSRKQRMGFRRSQGDTPDHVRKSKLGFAMLSQFARVTQVARDAGGELGQLLGEGLRFIQGSSNLPSRNEVLFSSEDGYRDSGGDLAKRYSGDNRTLPPAFKAEQRRGVPVSRQAWNESFTRLKGSLIDPLAMKQSIFDGGLEPDARSESWPFILGMYSWNSTRQEREQLLSTLRAEYEGIRASWLPISTRSTSTISAGRRMDASGPAQPSDTIDDSNLDSSVSFANDSTQHEEGCGSPLDPLQQIAWNILEQAREVFYGERGVELHFDSPRLKEQSLQIAKDVLRTDRFVPGYDDEKSPLLAEMTCILMTYGVRVAHIGYCQGMSDMLSPILYAFRNHPDREVLSFWCFSRLMDRVNANFREDQSGIRAQLKKIASLMRLADRDLSQHFMEIDPDYHAVFRWLLVHFKREFQFEDISRVWEIFWLDFVAERDLHLYLAVSILLQHRERILLDCSSFPELLRYINDLSLRLDVDLCLSDATDLFYRIGPITIEEQTPPSLLRENSFDAIQNSLLFGSSF